MNAPVWERPDFNPISAGDASGRKVIWFLLLVLSSVPQGLGFRKGDAGAFHRGKRLLHGCLCVVIKPRGRVRTEALFQLGLCKQQKPTGDFSVKTFAIVTTAWGNILEVSAQRSGVGRPVGQLLI